ncbi:hypothetical protein GCM10023188_04110 [Pontibacter saemangeumensis]|uniref:NAD(P)-binding domain-containing protein n=1 Tax=Pontibacter saemangeumensis TaxID=1084525 RepID=A0ABP8L9W4_9BACT
MIEASALDYTILRPTWFTHADEADCDITRKGELEKGTVKSQKSLAAFIASLMEAPKNIPVKTLA